MIKRPAWEARFPGGSFYRVETGGGKGRRIAAVFTSKSV